MPRTPRTETGRNPRLDAFFDRPDPWQNELRRLREIVLDFPVTEDLRWRQPCYGYRGGNVAILSRRKAGATLSFFRGALMDDPEGLLVQPGEHSQAARYLLFTGTDQIDRLEPTIRAYIDNALQVHASGRRVAFTEKHELVYPDELTEALARDPDLAAAFDALTPGRQRSHVLHISAAKQSATRTARVERCRPRIVAGKGFNER